MFWPFRIQLVARDFFESYLELSRDRHTMCKYHLFITSLYAIIYFLACSVTSLPTTMLNYIGEGKKSSIFPGLTGETI